MYFDELLNKVSEPADIAIFLVGFAIGYILDLLFMKGGAPAGTIAGIVSIILLGLKKGLDAYLANASWIAKRRIKRRLRILNDYFADNPGALKVIKELNIIFDAQLIDHNSFDHFLNEHLQKYIEDELKLSGDLQNKYENLYNELQKKNENIYNDFKKLYEFALFPEQNRDELAKFRRELEKRYFPRQRISFRDLDNEI